MIILLQVHRVILWYHVLFPPLDSNLLHNDSRTWGRRHRRLNTIYWLLWEKRWSVLVQWEKRSFFTPLCGCLGPGKTHRRDYLSPTSGGQSCLWTTSSLTNKSHCWYIWQETNQLPNRRNCLWAVWRPLGHQLLPLRCQCLSWSGSSQS